MPDGSVREGTAWETSPMDIAKSIAKSLSERVVIAKVRPIELETARRIIFLSPQNMDTEPRTTDHKETRQRNTTQRKDGITTL